MTDKITLADWAAQAHGHPLYKEAIRVINEQLQSHAARQRVDWTWWDRLNLAWEVLRGRITWSDIK